jgi:glycosyltransferase involved in cell wall biosynthesis
MKIGLLSQWFDPETGPAAVPGIFAREFRRSGHEAAVLTGFPNYPDGAVYPGYRQTARTTSSIDGVRVTRVPLYPSHNGSAVGRLLNYASFGASASVLGWGALRDADALWVYNSPITVSLPLLTHSRWGAKPYFLHVQDLWPDSLLESGMFQGGLVGDRVASLIRAIVRVTERQAAAIGVISPSVRDLILSRNPKLEPSKIVYVPNPTDESVFYPLSWNSDPQPSVDWRDAFTVMYVGAVGEVQGLDTVLDAAELLRAKGDIRIVIVGDGIARARLERQARERGIENVTFLGRVPKEQVPSLMKTADLHLVSLGASNFLEFTTPSKIASLLASEVPVVGQIAGDGARLIHSAGAGLTSTPGNAAELADVILHMSNLGGEALRVHATNGRSYYEANLSAEMTARKIVASLAGTAIVGGAA